MDEGRVEPDSAAEESFVAEFHGHVVGLARGAEIDEVESLVASVVGTTDGTGNHRVVIRGAIA